METVDIKKSQSVEMPTNFPRRLYQLLEDLHDVVKPPIRWNADGLSFTIRDKAELRNVIQKHFNQTRFTSFTRQLNIYGFNKVVHGVPKRSYYHPDFQRVRRDLLKNIVRIPIKSKIKKGKSLSRNGAEYPRPTQEGSKEQAAPIFRSAFPQEYSTSSTDKSPPTFFYTSYIMTPYGPYSMMYPFINCFPTMISPNSYPVSAPYAVVSDDKFLSNNMDLSEDLLSSSSSSMDFPSSDFSRERDDLDELNSLFENEEPI